MCVTSSGAYYKLDFIIAISVLSDIVLSSTEATWPPTAWTKETYPNPRVDTSQCGRNRKQSWICDPNLIVSFASAEEMDKMAEAYREGTCWCDCAFNGGPTIAVAFIPRVTTTSGFPDVNDRQATVEAFADYLREVSWRYTTCDDMISVVLSAFDKKVGSSVGSDLGEVLTDTCIQVVRREVQQLIANGSSAAAASHILTEYRRILNGERTCGTAASSAASSEFSWFIVPVVLFVVIIIVLASINPMSRYISGQDLVPWCESTGRGHRVGVAFAGGARGRRSTIGVSAAATWGMGMNNGGVGVGGGGVAWSTGVMENGSWTLGGGGSSAAVHS